MVSAPSPDDLVYATKAQRVRSTAISSPSNADECRADPSKRFRLNILRNHTTLLVGAQFESFTSHPRLTTIIPAKRPINMLSKRSLQVVASIALVCFGHGSCQKVLRVREEHMLMVVGSIDRPSGGFTFKTQYQSPYVSNALNSNHKT